MYKIRINIYKYINNFLIFFFYVSQNNASLLWLKYSAFMTCLHFDERGYSGQFMLTFKMSDTKCAALSIVILRIFICVFLYVVYVSHNRYEMNFIFFLPNSRSTQYARH